MTTCCCYRKYDGSDEGCVTVAGSTCPTIAGYKLVSSSPGPCAEGSKASSELKALVEDAVKDSADKAPTAIDSEFDVTYYVTKHEKSDDGEKRGSVQPVLKFSKAGQQWSHTHGGVRKIY